MRCVLVKHRTNIGCGSKFCEKRATCGSTPAFAEHAERRWYNRADFRLGTHRPQYDLERREGGIANQNPAQGIHVYRWRVAWRPAAACCALRPAEEREDAGLSGTDAPTACERQRDPRLLRPAGLASSPELFASTSTPTSARPDGT